MMLEILYKDWMLFRVFRQKLIMRNSAKVGRRIAIASIGLALGTCAVFCVGRVILFYQGKVETLVKTDKRTFLIDGNFPAALSNSPWFEVTCVMQALCAASALSAYSGIDSLFGELALHLCGQLEILIDEIDDLTSWDNEKNIQEAIFRIVERHNELNRFLWE